MHSTAFIITSVTLDSPADAEPTDDQLRQAAKEAIVIAKDAQTDPEGIDYESFAIGCRQHRFIQGQALNNGRYFGLLPEREWPETSYEVMSQIREPDLSDQGIAAIPTEILRNCWNSGHNLVRLALKNWDTPKKYPGDHGLIYPDLLLRPDGIMGHCVGFPDENVLGETHQEPIDQTTKAGPRHTGE